MSKWPDGRRNPRPGELSASDSQTGKIHWVKRVFRGECARHGWFDIGDDLGHHVTFWDWNFSWHVPKEAGSELLAKLSTDDRRSFIKMLDSKMGANWVWLGLLKTFFKKGLTNAWRTGMDSIRGGRGLVVAELSLRPQKAARFELLLVYVCCWTTNCEPLRRKTFSQWISRQTDAEDADTFALHAYIAGENAATSTRATGLFHSRYLLRNYKGNPNIANQS